MVSVLGFSFSGQGQNAALAFVTLKDWDERGAPGQSAQALAGRTFGAMMGVKDAFIFPLSPPPIPELGAATGFNFRLQDRGGNGHDALIAARNQMLGMASQSKLLAGVRPDGLEDAPQLQHRHRPRQGRRPGRRLRRHQRRHLDGLRLDLRQRLPEPGPAAARGGAGRRAGAHAARRPSAPERAEQPWATGAAVGLRQHALDHRADAVDPLQRLSDDAHRRRRRTRRQHRRGDGRDGAAGRCNCPPASASNGPASRARSASPVPPRSTCSASRCWRSSSAWRPCTRAGRFRSR